MFEWFDIQTLCVLPKLKHCALQKIGWVHTLGQYCIIDKEHQVNAAIVVLKDTQVGITIR